MHNTISIDHATVFKSSFVPQKVDSKYKDSTGPPFGPKVTNEDTQVLKPVQDTRRNHNSTNDCVPMLAKPTQLCLKIGQGCLSWTFPKPNSSNYQFRVAEVATNKGWPRGKHQRS